MWTTDTSFLRELSNLSSNTDFTSFDNIFGNNEKEQDRYSQIWEGAFNTPPVVAEVSCLSNRNMFPINGTQGENDDYKRKEEEGNPYVLTDNQTNSNLNELKSTSESNSHNSALKEVKINLSLNQRKKNLWTIDEDEKLKQAMEKSHPSGSVSQRRAGDWKKITDIFHGRRTVAACKKRGEVLKLRGGTEKKTKRNWTDQEDMKLKVAMQYHLSMRNSQLKQEEWEKIAKSLNRTVSACKNRVTKLKY